MPALMDVAPVALEHYHQIPTLLVKMQWLRTQSEFAMWFWLSCAYSVPQIAAWLKHSKPGYRRRRVLKYALFV